MVPKLDIYDIIIKKYSYYGPRVISVKDTKTRPWRVSRLYGTSGAIGRGVAELRRLRSKT